jgi:2-keto-4-pentenoate hydratase/2-oxohepta-3-ene-1,7-dioic acid hydratase in catechol pathway
VRLVTFSRGGGNQRLGAVLGTWDRWETIVDLHAADPALPGDMGAFVDLAGGLSGETWDRARRVLRDSPRTTREAGPAKTFRPDEVHVHAPIAPRLLRDFLAFRGHVARARAAIGSGVALEWDRTPAYFNENHLNVIGPDDTVPRMQYEIFEGGHAKTVETQKLDYEAEVGFVLGVGGHRIESRDANSHLFGVTIFNDFSARDIQLTATKVGMGPAPGKDWANALGPCIVTRDEFGELMDQRIAVRVNGEERLRERYHDMVYKNPFVKEGERAVWTFPEKLEFLSRSQTIHAGEVWGSGTIPGGCELERGDQARYLLPGDRVEIEIEGIGILANSVATSL